MNRVRCRSMLVAFGTALIAGCGAPPGQPRADAVPRAPQEIVEFGALYSDNCAGCHGANGRGGAAIALADPVYLAVVDDNAMHQSVASGVRGTSMPAFAQQSGGMLTDTQIDVLLSGIRSQWSRAGALEGNAPPSYAANTAGDIRRGAVAYQAYCESCHGPGGKGARKGSAITNSSFLALLSDQGLRTIVIAGRPELGAPDWRGNVLGRPMSDQEITDVVSWLASHRVATPGQPYETTRNEGRQED